jgi:hypothetical protein
LVYTYTYRGSILRSQKHRPQLLSLLYKTSKISEKM